MKQTHFLVTLASESSKVLSFDYLDVKAALEANLIKDSGVKLDEPLKVSVVEQNVERPLDQDKMISLLRKASSAIGDYERDDCNCKLDSIAAK